MCETPWRGDAHALVMAYENCIIKRVHAAIQGNEPQWTRLMKQSDELQAEIVDRLNGQPVKVIQGGKT